MAFEWQHVESQESRTRSYAGTRRNSPTRDGPAALKSALSSAKTPPNYSPDSCFPTFRGPHTIVLLKMLREALQTVFRYDPLNCGITVSRPAHYRVDTFFFQLSATAELSITDKAYAIVFIIGLAVSILILGISRYVSGDALLAKDVVKVPRFRVRQYEVLPTHVENGNGIAHSETKRKWLEPYTGWRWRMGVLLELVLIALVALHAFILVTEGLNILRIMFIVYWVRFGLQCILTSGNDTFVQLTEVSPDLLSTVSIHHCLRPAGAAVDIYFPNRRLAST